MKSTKAEKNPFTMDDFVQGLMLAGYLIPGSIEEINQREALKKHEEEQVANSPKKLYFKRVVLAAEIVSKLYQEPTLGRIKFQKLVYLCEHRAGMDLQNRYSKQAAGPFDNKFMHSIDREFKKNKWFSAVKETTKDGLSRTKFIPLDNPDGHKTYFERYFHSENEQIQYIINLFRNMSTDKTELAATVFACVKELNSSDGSVEKGKLLTLFYEWSEKKKRFSEQEVLDSLDWLQEKGLINIV